jgi:hypothetical protein
LPWCKDNTPTFSWQIPEEIPAGLDYYEVGVNVAPHIPVYVDTYTQPVALPDGEHYFQVRAIDKEAKASPTASLVFIIDTIKPTVTITDIPDYVNSLPSISGSA